MVCVFLVFTLLPFVAMSTAGLCCHRPQEQDKRGGELHRLGIERLRLGLKKKSQGNHRDALSVLMEGINFLEEAGDVASCLRAWKAVQYSFTKVIGTGDDERLAMILSQQGKCLERLERVGDAAKKYSAAMEMCKRIKGSSVGAAINQGSLACCQARLHRWREALSNSLAALPVLRCAFGKRHENVATCLNNIAVCQFRTNRLRKAISTCNRALEVWKGLGDELNTVRTLEELSDILAAAGRMTEAYERASEAADCARAKWGEAHPEAIRATVAVARCLRRRGEYAEALKECEKLQSLIKGRSDGAEVIEEVALCASACGQHARALEFHQKALRLRMSSQPTDSLAIATSYVNLGAVFADLGLYQEAAKNLEKSLEIRRSFHGENHPSVARGLNNLSTCLAALGQKDRSLEMIRRSLKIMRSVWKEAHAELAWTLNSFGAALNDLGRYEEALPHLQESLKMRQKLFPENHPVISVSWYNVGLALWNLKRPDEGREAFERALAIARKSASTRLPQMVCTLARLCYENGDLEQAKKLCDEAIEAVEISRVRARDLDVWDRAAYFAELRRGGPYTGLTYICIDRGDLEGAIQAQEKSRGRAILDLLQTEGVDLFDEERKGAAKQAGGKGMAGVDDVTRRLGAARIQVDNLARKLAWMAQKGDHTERDKREARALAEQYNRSVDGYRKVLREKAGLLGRYTKLGQPASVSDIRACLKKGEFLLMFHLNPERNLVFLVGPSGTRIRMWELDLDPKKLITEAERYLAFLRRKGRRISRPRLEPGRSRGAQFPDRPGGLEAGNQLFKMLIPPGAWKAIKSCSRLFVIPDSIMFQVPFEALVVETKPKVRYWLDDGPSISYSTSGSMLLRIRQDREQRHPEKQPVELVALGNPIFHRRTGAKEPGAGSADLPPLPGTDREVRALAEVFREKRAGRTRVCVLTKEAATEANLRRECTRARLVHIATHHVVGDGRVASGLVLTAPSAITDKDDGFLRLRDLLDNWRGALRSCELVVLSACSTSGGSLLMNEGVVAMPWGFFYSGAPTVIASQWVVHDKITATLMADYYRKLVRSGQDKLEALTSARKELKRKIPDPHYWASFVLLGDPR